MSTFTTTINRVTIIVNAKGDVSYDLPKGMRTKGFKSWKERNAAEIKTFIDSVTNRATERPLKATASKVITPKLRRGVGYWSSRDYSYGIVKIAKSTWKVDYMGDAIAYFTSLRQARQFIAFMPILAK